MKLFILILSLLCFHLKFLIRQGGIFLFHANVIMDSEDFLLAQFSTSSSVLHIPCEDPWYMAAWGVAEISVATGECLSSCLRPLLHPHSSFLLQQLSSHLEASTFSGPKH